jgi:folate-binding protein YgfZ
VTLPRDGYLAALESAAAFRVRDRGVLLASGPDRQKFLQAMLSNEVLSLRPGEGRAAALLDVKGHVQALLRVLVAPNAVSLEMPRDRLEAVKATLEHYKVAAPVRFAVTPVAVLALLGPEAEAVLTRSGGDAPPADLESHRETSVAGFPARAVRAGDLPGAGVVLHVAEADADAVFRSLLAASATELEEAQLEALRVETGRAWYGRDVTEANLLHETPLVAACCSFQKGCYLGQEVVARLDARGGHVNKRLRGLRLEAEASAGCAVLASGQEVGRITTAAVSPRLGPIALAYLHRSHTEPGSRVEVDGRPATVADLPLQIDLPRSA